MIEYRTLENVSDDELYTAFSKAFVDYFVSFDMGVDRFMTSMLRRKSFNSEISIGAYSNGEMVGFVYNGLRDINGQLTAYDCGTGMVPEFRGKGVGKEILLKTDELLIKNNVTHYLLEVIQKNTPAVNLYLKQNFVVTRELNCYTSLASRFPLIDDPCLIECKATKDIFIDEYFDFQPSWQNSVASVLAVPDEFTCVVYRQGNEPLGFGAIETRSGDIPIIAVAKNHRMEGIGTKILHALAHFSQSENIRWINIEDTDETTNRFLQKKGFDCEINQYEMVKKLQAKV